MEIRIKRLTDTAQLPKRGSEYAAGSKQGLRPANCVGVIDADYRGQISVALSNDSEVERTIEPQERIAQLVILPFLPVEFIDSEELSDTVRGAGGFGSTGTKN